MRLREGGCSENEERTMSTVTIHDKVPVPQKVERRVSTRHSEAPIENAADIPRQLCGEREHAKGEEEGGDGRQCWGR
jgi:hypothetical protein